MLSKTTITNEVKIEEGHYVTKKDNVESPLYTHYKRVIVGLLSILLKVQP